MHFVSTAQIIWYEDFNLPNNTTVDNGATAWTTDLAWDCSGSVSGSFDVQSGQFVGNETDCEARWVSEWIDVSAYPAVQIYAVLDGAGSLDAGGGNPDTNKVGYRTDGGTSVTWLDEYAGTQVINSISCGGSVGGADSVQIVVQMESTGGDEYHYLDDVTVAAAPSVSGGGGDTLYSRQDGDYDATGTWSSTRGGASCGCIPDSNSIVYITCGDQVLIDSDEWAREVHVEFGGRLRWDSGGDELNISSNGIVEIAVGAYIWEDGEDNAWIDFEGSGNCTLSVFSEDIGLEIDQLRVNGNCSLLIEGNGRMDIEDEINITSAAVVTSKFTSQIYVGDDFEITGQGATFINDSSYIYIENLLELDANDITFINRDTLYINNDIDGNNADDGQFTNYGYVWVDGDDFEMSNNSDNFRVDNFGAFRIDDDLKESGTGGAACEWHNRAGGYLELGHDDAEVDWEVWANYDSNTVDYFRTANQLTMFTPEDAYWNLTISGSGTKRPLADLDINGSVLIEGGAIFDPNTGNHDLTVAKNWRVTSTAGTPFNYGTESVTFDGAGRQWVNADDRADFYDVTINKSDSLVLLSSMLISTGGDLTLTSGHINSDSTDRLIIADNATVTGTSNASFVDGRVEKRGDEAFTFPVGDVGDYQPISISAPTNTTHAFSAEYFQVDPRNNWDPDAFNGAIHHVSTEEYWILNRTNGTSDVSVTLSFDANSGGVTDLDSLVVARWNSSLWADEGNGGTSGNTSAGTVTSGAPVTAFSPFTLASISSSYSGNPLPVEWLSFTAVREKMQTRLTWATASETDNEQFQIQRSLDNEFWEVISVVPGAGNSNATLSYTSMDRDAPTSRTYYRLKQIDVNGQMDYSEVRSIEPYADEKDHEWFVYPNPISRSRMLTINLSGSNTRRITALLRDVSGRSMLRRTLLIEEGGISASLALTDQLHPGPYVLTLICDDGDQYVTKLLIQE
ncbi:MAG: hypothetical protein RLP15_09645 [Cryomorphaceae bacterium]